MVQPHCLLRSVIRGSAYKPRPLIMMSRVRSSFQYFYPPPSLLNSTFLVQFQKRTCLLNMLIKKSGQIFLSCLSCTKFPIKTRQFSKGLRSAIMRWPFKSSQGACLNTIVRHCVYLLCQSHCHYSTLLLVIFISRGDS